MSLLKLTPGWPWLVFPFSFVAEIPRCRLPSSSVDMPSGLPGEHKNHLQEEILSKLKFSCTSSSVSLSLSRYIIHGQTVARELHAARLTSNLDVALEYNFVRKHIEYVSFWT